MLGRFGLALHVHSAPKHSDARLPGVNAIVHDDNPNAGPLPTIRVGIEGDLSSMNLMDRFESFKSNVEREEKRAFYARLVVAWSRRLA